MAAKKDTFGSICAVAVTYNIGEAFAPCFASLKPQVNHAILVNTSNDGGVTTRALEALQTQNAKFTDIIPCPQNNLGLAQNLGIARALELGYDWVLLLDHDSHLEDGMIDAMKHAYQQDPLHNQIGLIAPYLDDPAIRNPPKYLREWQRYIFTQSTFSADTPVLDNILCVPASGSLIPRRILDRPQPMDEGFVIDNIDTDFCLKLVTSGQRIIAVRDAKLTHKIGDRKHHSLLGIEMTTTNHSPLRRYYFNRNRIAVWKRHTAKHPAFLLFDSMRMAYELWRILLLESNKNEKLNYFMAGLFDGLRGLSGPKPGT